MAWYTPSVSCLRRAIHMPMVLVGAPNLSLSAEARYSTRFSGSFTAV
jgi:hypothetical protein